MVVRVFGTIQLANILSFHTSFNFAISIPFGAVLTFSIRVESVVDVMNQKACTAVPRSVSIINFFLHFCHSYNDCVLLCRSAKQSIMRHVSHHFFHQANQVGFLSHKCALQRARAAGS